MWQLNLPMGALRIKKVGERKLVFDISRKKWVSLTPEEWVRQHYLQFLTQEQAIPVSRISVEVPFQHNGMQKRCDMLIFSKDVKPIAIIEIKSPMVEITQSTADQIMVYNYSLQVPLLALSNGLQHVYFSLSTPLEAPQIITEAHFFDLLRHI